MHVRRVLLTCLHTFLLLAAIFAFFSRVHVSYATVINVPSDYPTIQEAIDAASSGDTINVSRRLGELQSVYYERLLINKQLILVGESRETIIIDAGGTGTVIRILADSVEIRGFTIRNAGSKSSGIRADDYSYLTIANNTIKTNRNGVLLVYSNGNKVVQNQIFNNSVTGIRISGSVGNNISDNNVSESAYGIRLSSTNATFVVGNAVADNSYGIYLEHSSNDTVDKNTLLGNGANGIFPYACQNIIVSNNEIFESAYGIEIHSSDTITVLGNNATNNSYGIYLAYSGLSNTIENNSITLNDWGVTLYSSSGNTFTGNILSYNTFGVDPVIDSNNNLFYHNNFDGNVEQVVWNPDCLNTWDDGYPSGGNYWSDYTGTDSNGDGIGDTAYIIDPMNKDRYPLMTPWGIAHDVAIANIALSATEVASGGTVYINVTASNEGTWKETFNVTAKYDSTVIEVQTVTDLAPNENITLTFNWITVNVDPSTYTIKAEATILPYETDTADNTYTDGTVTVTPIHDVAITNMIVTPATVPVGQLVYINVTVQNQGHFSENFNVTVYADSTAGDVHDHIGNETVSLDPGNSTVLMFTWNTTALPVQQYWITAEAVLPEDQYPEDNIVIMTIVIFYGHSAGGGLFQVLIFP